MGPSQSVKAVCQEFTNVDQRNTWKVDIWYPHRLASGKRSLHRLLLLFSENIGFNKKNKSEIEYPNLLSAIRPMPRSNEIPVPVVKQLPPLEDLSDIGKRSDSNNCRF